MSYGISPDFLIVRADTEIPEDMMSKIAAGTGVKREHTIAAPTLDSIYRVPLAFHSTGVGEKILAKLGITPKTIDMSKWQKFLTNIENSSDILRIAMVGKYVGLEDAYYSLNE